MTPVLELTGIAKRFGSTAALDGVDFTLRAGEIHALLGENGAGKSTLMHIVVGLLQPSGGSVRVRGKTVRIDSPTAARKLRIGMVHQHFTSIPTLTVRENLALAAGDIRASASRPPVDGANVSATERLRRRLWAGLDPAESVERLTVGAKQRLEILQAIATEADILLLDEPAGVLTPPETAELYELLRAFTAAGGSAVLITHKIPDAVAVADHITVLRRGRVTLEADRGAVQVDAIAGAMVGEALLAHGDFHVDKPTASGSSHGGLLVNLMGVRVHRGEIVGIAAVEGNGQRELLRGAVATNGVKAAFIPEDRTTEGLIPAFSLTDNLILGRLDDERWAGRWMLDRDAAESRMGELIARFGIRTDGPAARASTLSGGNQQKVVLARALEGTPDLLVAENPTRGLDFRSTAFVHQRIGSAAVEGVGVLLYSADLDEVLALSNRVYVLVQGRATPAPEGAGRDVVGAMMVGAR